jgi:hypothetical protein
VTTEFQKKKKNTNTSYLFGGKQTLRSRFPITKEYKSFALSQSYMLSGYLEGETKKNQPHLV